MLQINDDNVVTEMTQVTEFKGATHYQRYMSKEDYNNSNNIIANPKIVPFITIRFKPGSYRFFMFFLFLELEYLYYEFIIRGFPFFSPYVFWIRICFGAMIHC